MRPLVLLFLLPVAGAFALSVGLTLIPVDEKLKTGEHKRIPFDAVGFIEEIVSDTKERTEKTYQTGFFYEERKFLTARSAGARIACRGKTVIHAGAFDVTPGMSTPSHRCVRVLNDDVAGGFTVLEVESLRKSERQAVIPLVDEGSEIDIDLRYAVVGFEYQSLTGTARLQISTGCEIRKATYAFGEELLAKFEGLKSTNRDWARAECLYRIGMAGSPVLVRERDRWVAVGVASPYHVSSRGSETDLDVLLFPKLARARRNHGGDLTGK